MGVAFKLNPWLLLSDCHRSLSVQLNSIESNALQALEPAGRGGVSDQALAALEGRLSHQLSEMQATVVKSSQSGGSAPLTASEQMQPIYDLKAKMQELQAQFDSLQKAVQVRERERAMSLDVLLGTDDDPLVDSSFSLSLYRSRVAKPAHLPCQWKVRVSQHGSSWWWLWCNS